MQVFSQADHEARHWQPQRHMQSWTLEPAPTVLLGCLIVLLAHQTPIFHEVELITRGQLAVADYAGKAVQVIDKVLGLSDHLCGRNPLLARSAFCTKTPAKMTRYNTSVHSAGNAQNVLRISAFIQNKRERERERNGRSHCAHYFKHGALFKATYNPKTSTE